MTSRLDQEMWICDVQESIVAGPAAIPIGMMAVGSIFQASGQMQQGAAAAAEGEAKQTADNYQAAELQTQANQVRGQADREAYATDRNTQLTLSMLRARGAGNGLAGSPEIATLGSGIAGRGEYDVLSNLASG